MSGLVDFDGEVWLPRGYADEAGRPLYWNREDTATREEVALEFGILRICDLRGCA